MRIARKIGLTISENNIIQQLQSICNKEVGYILTTKTILEIFKSIYNKIKNDHQLKEILSFLEHSIEILGQKLPLSMLKDNYISNSVLKRFKLMTIENIDRIMEIEKESFDYPWKHSSSFKEYVDKNQAFEIYIGEELVGYYLLDKEHRCIKINKMAVDKKYRRQKLGTFIIQCIIEYARKCNYNKLALHVRDSNTEAVDFYRHVGFITTNTIPDYYKKTDHDTAIEMTLIV